MSDISPATWPGRVAVAVVRSDPPEIVVASDATVLTRVIALELVARTSPKGLSEETVADLRDALLEERWDHATALWMEATGNIVDAYPDDVIWTDASLDHQLATMEMRMLPIFGDIPAPE